MTSPRTPLIAALLGALALASPASAANPRETLIASKGGSVVSVKITAKITGSFGERSFDQERNMTSSGVLVDPSGLVMVPSGAVAAPRRQGMDVKVTPTSIRVIFPGDEKEYDAILGAVDSKIGLAYVLIRDLAGRKAECVDTARVLDPAIGDTLYTVTRLGQGFDYALVCQTATVIGAVTKPRVMWVLDGEAPEAGQPLYTADGALTGFMVEQEGVGEGGGRQVCLLPLKIATSSIERSLKAAQKELEDVKVREAEAAAKAREAAEKPPEKPPEAPAEPVPAAPGAGR